MTSMDYFLCFVFILGFIDWIDGNNNNNMELLKNNEKRMESIRKGYNSKGARKFRQDSVDFTDYEETAAVNGDENDNDYKNQPSVKDSIVIIVIKREPEPNETIKPRSRHTINANTKRNTRYNTDIHRNYTKHFNTDNRKEAKNLTLEMRKDKYLRKRELLSKADCLKEGSKLCYTLCKRSFKKVCLHSSEETSLENRVYWEKKAEGKYEMYIADNVERRTAVDDDSCSNVMLRKAFKKECKSNCKFEFTHSHSDVSKTSSELSALISSENYIAEWSHN